MVSGTRRFISALLFTGIASVVPQYSLADTFSATYLAPGVQTPAGITTTYETFDGSTFANGTSSITGTYTGSYNLVSANTYGGAGGTGRYIQTTGPGSYTLSLNAGSNYFGLWFSALDAGNQLQFFNGNTLLYTFLPSTYAQLVGVCPTSAPQPNFCGNPNTNFFNQDSGEQFAYLNFYDLSGTFNKVVFTETISGNGFESDNQTAALLGNGTPIIGTPLGATPEPASWVYGLTACGMMAAFCRASSRRNYMSNKQVG